MVSRLTPILRQQRAAVRTRSADPLGGRGGRHGPLRRAARMSQRVRQDRSVDAPHGAWSLCWQRLHGRSIPGLQDAVGHAGALRARARPDLQCRWLRRRVLCLQPQPARAYFGELEQKGGSTSGAREPQAKNSGASARSFPVVRRVNHPAHPIPYPDHPPAHTHTASALQATSSQKYSQ